MSRNPDFDAVMIKKTELETLDAVIERLTALLDAKTTPGYELLAGIIERRDAEIKRLTEEVNALRLVATAHDVEMTRLETEIARLQAALESLTMKVLHALAGEEG